MICRVIPFVVRCLSVWEQWTVCVCVCCFIGNLVYVMAVFGVVYVCELGVLYTLSLVLGLLLGIVCVGEVKISS